MACAAVGVFFAVSALDGGGTPRTTSANAPVARLTSTTPAPRAVYQGGAPHVLAGITVYPLGSQFQKPGARDDPPRPAVEFKHPIAVHTAYSVSQLNAMTGQIAQLESALAANDRTAARSAWRNAYACYLRLGAVYLEGKAAELDKQIDGTAGGLPGGASNPEFEGLHRIEYGLWSETAPRALLGYARRLDAAVQRLREILPHVAVTPLMYATRAHEILEDAVRDLLSGVAVPWSGEGPFATQAGIEATEEIVATLRHVFTADDQVPHILEIEFATLRSAMASIARAHGGRLPSNTQLTQQQSELLDGALGGTLEALSLLPPALDTEPFVPVTAIPKHDVRIDQ